MVTFYTYLEIYLDDLNKQIALSEFEKHFNKPHQTIKNQIRTLVDANILIEEKKIRSLSYKINKDNPKLNDYLSICEKEKMFKFIDERPLIRQLYTLIAPKTKNILIFGSTITTEKFNDIDLLIISEKDIKNIITNFETTYSVKIHTIQTNQKDLTKTLLTEIRKKHIILKNHDYFVELLYNEN
ncbi:MAG: hypothetical protein K0B07_01660 [DPANN group archaeon]|nr:hypothetical protein [DPANN group archaeon]